MAYVDEVYYNDSFSGEPVDTTDFPSLCRRAEEIIEEMTLYRVTPVTVFPGDARRHADTDKRCCVRTD